MPHASCLRPSRLTPPVSGLTPPPPPHTSHLPPLPTSTENPRTNEKDKEEREREFAPPLPLSAHPSPITHHPSPITHTHTLPVSLLRVSVPSRFTPHPLIPGLFSVSSVCSVGPLPSAVRPPITHHPYPITFEHPFSPSPLPPHTSHLMPSAPGLRPRPPPAAFPFPFR